MTFKEYEELYYEISDKANELFGGESEHFKNNLQKLKEGASDSVSYEIIYSVTLHESLKYQQDFIFLNLGKRLLNEDF